jgi:methionyl-tRNA formyltransferase
LFRSYPPTDYPLFTYYILRIIFLGTPDFAVPSLSILLENGYHVPAVVTAPDKPGGRQGIQQSAVKKFALSKGLDVLQPEKLRNPDFLAQLKSYNADLQVVVAFRMLPEMVWNMPRLGTLNVHGSLLPKYRGAAPINWAIINGEKETGLTTFLLKHEIDTGDMLDQVRLAIGPDETAGELHDRMMLAGAELLLRTVQNLERGSIIPRPQPDEEATHAPKIFTETCKINFDQHSQQVHNFVRGLSPHPTAWTVLDGKNVKIYRTALPNAHHAVPGMQPPGTFFSDGKQWLNIRTADAYVSVLELQMEGKKRMTAKEFLNGYRLA